MLYDLTETYQRDDEAQVSARITLQRCQVELDLKECQVYSWQKINYHSNYSLKVGSLTRDTHHLTVGQPNGEPFSIADIKTVYTNENLALRIICGYGIDMDSPIIRRLMLKFRKNISAEGLNLERTITLTEKKSKYYCPTECSKITSGRPIRLSRTDFKSPSRTLYFS